jgi:mannose-6-phosphate isomerase-like protein (cupin superfamily)
MRRSIMLLALTAISFGAALTQARADEVVYVPAAKVTASMTTPGTLASGSDHNVSMSRRDRAGQSEVHDTETDVFYIMEGSATFVTGGTIVDAKTTAPGQIRGTGITGGTTHTLAKGDVIVIPKGTPHWFKEVPEVVVYFVVKAK